MGELQIIEYDGEWTEPPGPGIYSGVPEAIYHGSRTSLSVSGAKLLLPPSCPAKFRWSMDNPRKPKKEFDFGHIVHGIVLGVGDPVFVMDPQVYGLLKDGSLAASPTQTKAWKDAAAAARDRGEIPVKVDDWVKADEMAAAVREDQVSGPLFEHGLAELSIYAVDPETGILLRGRTDWITWVDTVLNIIDLKTSMTANPAELKRKWWALSYHMQDPWYRRLLRLLGVADEIDFRFVAVDKEAPHLVTVPRYIEAARAEGERLNRQAIDLYAECSSTDDWPGYATSTVPLDIPGWVYRDGIDSDAQALIAELEGITES
ncbi:PD-(D/E)XK nuclease-like domain-containing protein [Mycolicibacterium mucogenicum]|uniref:PD-(D/E)XK nuclease-like domain-containing protein n=1 Tax=Mycolicibacterium mucogenicum DSM 44124 TaxID=1226753 RepID=A0A8E4W3F8_MYCMU|nr:PD-(D/E)XK nuclease-like domain-containing protein [Mycolicibacterium mucogenicum]KAB7761214.1 recE [Mycolicibacterium mucogenicum DSM 44124]QPG70036.1 PD-(D/E)XK nuclease-like domain-containing protein [Mycolicibacterium mucogenicum DSM 44124]